MSTFRNLVPLAKKNMDGTSAQVERKISLVSDLLGINVFSDITELFVSSVKKLIEHSLPMAYHKCGEKYKLKN